MLEMVVVLPTPVFAMTYVIVDRVGPGIVHTYTWASTCTKHIYNII